MQPHSCQELARSDTTAVGASQPQDREFGHVQTVDARVALWENDPEHRMERAFELLNAKGEGVDDAFRLDFVYDAEDYRTAVKVKRLSAAPIRFAPAVGYGCVDEGETESGVPLWDDGLGDARCTACRRATRGDATWQVSRVEPNAA